MGLNLGFWGPQCKRLYGYKNHCRGTKNVLLYGRYELLLIYWLTVYEAITNLNTIDQQDLKHNIWGLRPQLPTLLTTTHRLSLLLVGLANLIDKHGVMPCCPGSIFVIFIGEQKAGWVVRRVRDVNLACFGNQNPHKQSLLLLDVVGKAHGAASALPRVNTIIWSTCVWVCRSCECLF